MTMKVSLGIKEDLKVVSNDLKITKENLSAEISTFKEGIFFSFI